MHITSKLVDEFYVLRGGKCKIQNFEHFLNSYAVSAQQRNLAAGTQLHNESTKHPLRAQRQNDLCQIVSSVKGADKRQLNIENGIKLCNEQFMKQASLGKCGNIKQNV